MNTFDAFDRCLTDMAANMQIIEELESALGDVYSATFNGCAPSRNPAAISVNKPALNPFSNVALDRF